MTRSHAGFTLLEVVVASGLLVVLSLGTAQLFAIAIAQNVAARQQLVMGVLAAAKIDELSAAVASGPVEPTAPDALDRSTAGATDDVIEAGRRYVRRWRIAPVPGFDGEAWSIVVWVQPGAGAGGNLRLATIRLVGPA
jgi:prepilin-type N-terminal cleavage/methylation domain-containing protein